MSTYFCYILRCVDQSLYTGITTDLDRRVTEHNTNKKGAKYTLVRRPVEIVHSEAYSTRSEACKREYEIKQMTKQDKEKLIKQ